MQRRTPLRRKRPTPRRVGPPALRIKPEREDDPEHLAAVRRLRCSACGAPPPNEAHHIRDGQVGAGQKADDHEAIPLCSKDHRTGPQAIHRIGTRAWERIHGTQREHLARTLRLLEAPETT